MISARLVSIDQRSPEWHAWRMRVIGASEVAVLLGRSPWCSWRELVLRKAGALPSPPENAAMTRGRELEQAALVSAQFALGIRLSSGPCIEAPDLRLGASLDAFGEGVVLEIKCPASATSFLRHRQALPYYADQVRQQLWLARAAGLDAHIGVLYIWHPEMPRPIIHEIPYPSARWRDLVAARAKMFWDTVCKIQVRRETP